MWKKRTGALALALLCLLLSSCAAPHRGGAFDVGSDVVPLPSATPHPTLPAPPTPITMILAADSASFDLISSKGISSFFAAAGGVICFLKQMFEQTFSYFHTNFTVPII